MWQWRFEFTQIDIDECDLDLRKLIIHKSDMGNSHLRALNMHRGTGIDYASPWLFTVGAEPGGQDGHLPT